MVAPPIGSSSRSSDRSSPASPRHRSRGDGGAGSILVAAIGRRLSYQFYATPCIHHAHQRHGHAILIRAQVFSLSFRGLHGEKLVQDAFTLLPAASTPASGS